MTTKRNSRVVSTLAVLVLSAVPVLAQRPIAAHGSASDEPVSMSRAAHGISVEHGVVRGDGAHYKAVFADGGIEFTPALGCRAPRDFPLRFALESIRRGDALVHEVAATTVIGARIDGNGVCYARGPAVTETYEIRADGVELSYTFDRPLPGRGELVVRERVETELAGEWIGEGRGGLRFNGVFGSVTIGSVLGVDARGHRAEGSLRFDGQHLDLVLPASFVDHAAYPLVLDPLIGGETTINSGGDSSDPDAAYYPGTNGYLVVWSRAFSASNQEVRARRVQSDGTPIGAAVTVSLSGVALAPSVAYLPDTDAFFVAWQHAASFLGPFDIYGRGIDASGSLSATLVIAGASASQVEPDVGGGQSGEVIVTWNEVGAGIRARRAALMGGIASTPGPVVAISTGLALDSRPAISKSSAGANAHVIVWQRDVPFSSPAVCATAVDSAINLLGPPLCLSGPLARTSPDVDGDGTDFTVVFETAEGATSKRDIAAQPARYDTATSALVTSGAEHLVAGDQADDERAPAVALLGPKVLVVWADETGVLAYEIAGRAFHPRTCVPCGLAFALPGTQAYNTGPVIASGFAAAPASDDALVVFASISQLPPFAGEVVAQRFEALGAGGTVADLGGRCGTAGGTAGANGPAAIGNTRFAVDLSGARAGAPFAALSLGLAGSPIACGSCRITVPVLSLPVPVARGSASVPIPLPCEPLLVGGAVEFQWLQLTTQTTACALLPGLVASNRLIVTIGP